MDKRGCKRTMLSVPAAAVTAINAAMKAPAENGRLIGDPKARKLITVVGISKSRLMPRPKTMIHVTTLMRSR